MGNLIWHEYSRLLSITATTYTIWAALWGCVFRKFFWDFIGGTLNDPGGIQPSEKVEVIVTLIVKVPLVQILAILCGLFLLAIELPLPSFKGAAVQRSLVVRVVLLLFQAFLAALFYQGTNGALWSLIALLCYSRAIAKGEQMEEAKENKGMVGRA